MDFEIENGVLQKYNGAECDVVLPSEVTSIGKEAFKGRGDLTSIKLPEGLRSIGEGAFWACKSLTEIEIPSSVTNICKAAFYFCSGLKSVEIPHGVESIGADAFALCESLTSATISDSVTSIGRSPFSGCEALTSITIDKNNRKYECIENCIIDRETKTLIASNKQGLIPSGVTQLGEFAFDESDVTDVSIPAGITSIGPCAFTNCSSLKSITIPSSVKVIGKCAFNGCVNLTTINIAEGVEVIEESAFLCCKALKNVTIPKSVKKIGEAAFRSCEALESITLPFIGEELNGTSNTSFGFIFGRPMPLGLKYVEITGGREIQASMFARCSRVESIKLPTCVESIAFGAFSDCTGLKKITIPFVGARANATKDSHFGYIFGAVNADQNAACIPHDLRIVEVAGGKSIAPEAFKECNIPTVKLSDSIKSIGKDAFTKCKGISTVIFNGTLKGWCEIKFDNISANPLYTGFRPKLYMAGGEYTEVKGDIQIPEGTTMIGDFAFGALPLTSVTIPNSVQRIGLEAFSSCESLLSVTLPKRLAGFMKKNLNESFGEIDYYPVTDRKTGQTIVKKKYRLKHGDKRIRFKFTK